MRSAKSEWKFIAITLFLVMATAVPTLASLFATEESELAEAHKVPLSETAREPASIPTVTPAEKLQQLDSVSIHNEIKFDLNCAGNKLGDFKFDQAYVQIRGKACGSVTEIPNLSVINKTNGFTASVFVSNGKEFQTDLIQLNKGENELFIQYRDRFGRAQEQVLKVYSQAL